MWQKYSHTWCWYYTMWEWYHRMWEKIRVPPCVTKIHICFQFLNNIIYIFSHFFLYLKQKKKRKRKTCIFSFLHTFSFFFSLIKRSLFLSFWFCLKLTRIIIPSAFSVFSHVLISSHFKGLQISDISPSLSLTPCVPFSIFNGTRWTVTIWSILRSDFVLSLKSFFFASHHILLLSIFSLYFLLIDYSYGSPDQWRSLLFFHFPIYPWCFLKF